MASNGDGVADVDPRRNLLWVIVAVAAGFGFAAAGGSILDGTGTSDTFRQAAPRALVGAVIGLVVAGLASWLWRRRAPRHAAHPHVLGAIVVVAGCLGALIGAGIGPSPATTDEPPPPAVEVSDATVSSPSRGASVPVPDDRDRGPEGFTDTQGTIILLSGLILVLAAMRFLAKQVDHVPIESEALFLEGREFIDDEDDNDTSESVAKALERSLASLTNSAAPRDAILAAYATLLDELESVGLGRQSWEGPMEHCRRCLTEARLPAGPIDALVELFAEARFGTRPMTDHDRSNAELALAESVDILRPRSDHTVGTTA